jgi:hypothetical protein
MHEVEVLVSASDPNSGLDVVPDAFALGHRAEIAFTVSSRGPIHSLNSAA